MAEEQHIGLERTPQDPFALLRQNEREYRSFYRATPLAEAVKLDDVKASFADGLLEVSVPLPAKPKATVTKVKIEDAGTPTKRAA